ncbi:MULTISPECIES: aminoglycoside phosphotransferase family protein [unclassified Streptomyces]|uniref:aminoglycoside phosphotransferase family protein n=1 Tax=unclassified Streptomyces TaxID=2593676 RepID=UPI000F515CC9|nr:aminoglycoside phosphotransferase family protein [Streptomyces sp. A2-16]QUC62827.1 aminoglycoside phosphotransferase family protein [Streptomyces sp. A2-16]
MGGPTGPVAAFAGRAAREALGELVSHAKSEGRLTRGHHNLNYIVPTPNWLDPQADHKFVMVRERQRAALPVVIRTWQDEAEILRAIGSSLPHVPRCLLKYGDITVMSYVDGVPLSSVCPNGKAVDQHLVRALAELLADMTQVGRKELPSLPQFWPRSSRDSRAFLRTLALATETLVRQRNWQKFGGLFATLGIPEDAMVRFAERVPAMISRPFGLLHTDLHRDNVIVSYEAGPPLICVDWELATYGDPLHDLATHLVRMGYPDSQWDEAVEAWRSAMMSRRPKAVNGLERDLRHYVAFERAQSVYPDVMRAATSLGESFDQKDLEAATEAVYWALHAAEEPLRLKNVPDEKAIERILFRWNVSHGKRHSRDRAVSSISWERDERVPEHREFSGAAVQEALFEEGAASADRVFKGTAHLSTAVRVAGVPYPVMVRRKVGAGDLRERRFLNEHAVLRAIEDSHVAVHAPRVLALGTSELGDEFTIHSFEGASGEIRPPDHPEGGLLPHEADDLVNQLNALTRVDCAKLRTDSRVPFTGFHEQLCEELIRMVSVLPKETLQLAGQLGLPTSISRLRQILGRHRVASRRAVLLHGDLNPWNMIRREDGTGLILIDWEMAVVGDPLYDLVRHIHLTPTLPEIRNRLFDRWSQLLPEDCTRGWRRDWRVYRWIETVRSAYVDLDRLVTRDSLEAPNVSRAVDTYAMTLTAATATLGLSAKTTANPYLALALPDAHREKASAGNCSAT